MNKVTCIDVSYWNGNVDFEKVKSSGIEAVIMRAGYGRVVSQKDTTFEQNYKNAKAAGLKIGAYWYSYADSVNAASLEAKACLEVLGDKTFDLPVYYDLEESKVTGLGKKTLTTMAETFCEAMSKAGHRPGVYANLNWFKNYLDYGELKSKYSIWLAQYYKKNGLDCDIWQNSSEGKIPGVNGNCDTNVIFNRDVLGVKKPNKQEETKTDNKDVFTVEMRTLKRGSEGEDVRALQILLAGRGCNGNMYTPDGIFGPNTEGAVKIYQKKKKLAVDGIAGPITMTSLLGVK